MTHNSPTDAYGDDKDGTHNAFDLYIDGLEISQYLEDAVNTNENRSRWTLHTKLRPNERTLPFLQPLNRKEVSVRFRIKFRSEDGITATGPWRSGKAALNWRRTQEGEEELFLYGEGRLNRDDSATKAAGGPINVTVRRFTTVGGRVVESEEGEGTITLAPENENWKSLWEARRQFEEDAAVQGLTSPDFLLFLANSARSTYRLLYSEGIAQGNGEWVYAAMIFLPLSIEYDLKYLLYTKTGSFKKEYEKHQLLELFDYLPFDLQDAIEEEFRSELVAIGRDSTFVQLRVFLKSTENAFTILRYLFDPAYAKRSLHLLEPDTTAILTCVSTATERVIGRTFRWGA